MIQLGETLFQAAEPLDQRVAIGAFCADPFVRGRVQRNGCEEARQDKFAKILVGRRHGLTSYLLSSQYNVVSSTLQTPRQV